MCKLCYNAKLVQQGTEILGMERGGGEEGTSGRLWKVFGSPEWTWRGETQSNNGASWREHQMWINPGGATMICRKKSLTKQQKNPQLEGHPDTHTTLHDVLLLPKNGRRGQRAEYGSSFTVTAEREAVRNVKEKRFANYSMNRHPSLPFEHPMKNLTERGYSLFFFFLFVSVLEFLSCHIPLVQWPADSATRVSPARGMHP